MKRELIHNVRLQQPVFENTWVPELQCPAPNGPLLCQVVNHMDLNIPPSRLSPVRVILYSLKGFQSWTEKLNKQNMKFYVLVNVLEQLLLPSLNGKIKNVTYIYKMTTLTSSYAYTGSYSCQIWGNADNCVISLTDKIEAEWEVQTKNHQTIYTYRTPLPPNLKTKNKAKMQWSCQQAKVVM